MVGQKVTLNIRREVSALITAPAQTLGYAPAHPRATYVAELPAVFKVRDAILLHF